MQSQDTALIPLRARDGSVRAYAVVDAADADFVNQWRWHIDQDGYVRRTVYVNRKYVTLLLHRVMLGLEAGNKLEGDHIDRDPLNNRRNNLRITPHSGNTQNLTSHRDSTSSHRGVFWHKRIKKWQAQVCTGGRNIHLGYFESEAEAAEAAVGARARLMPYTEN